MLKKKCGLFILSLFVFHVFLPKPKTKKALGKVPSRGPNPSFAPCSDSSIIVVEICSYLLIFVILLYNIVFLFLLFEMFFIWHYVFSSLWYPLFAYVFFYFIQNFHWFSLNFPASCVMSILHTIVVFPT